MDSFYNVQEARKLLEQIAIQRMGIGKKEFQLAFYNEDGGAGKTTTPIFINRPRSWKLIFPGDDISEEAVLRIQGVLCQGDLPPVTRPVKTEKNEQHYIRQGIALTAFGARYFEDCIANIQNITNKFSRVLPPGTMDDWVPSLFDGENSIDMANRYFTNRHDSIMEQVPFKSCVDPNQYLDQALGNNYIHTLENEVEYYEIRVTENGDQRYSPIEPIKLCVGDIVEAQMSFVVIPVKNKRFKVIIVLRSITLLETKPTQDANHARHRHQIQATVPKISLKRKIGYDDDEEEAARRKLVKLMLD